MTGRLILVYNDLTDESEVEDEVRIIAVAMDCYVSVG